MTSKHLKVNSHFIVANSPDFRLDMRLGAVLHTTIELQNGMTFTQKCVFVRIAKLAAPRLTS